jgi:hypothetical protein
MIELVCFEVKGLLNETENSQIYYSFERILAVRDKTWLLMMRVLGNWLVC